MAGSDDLKLLLDARTKGGTVQNALVESLGEEQLDHIENIITIAQQIRDPLLTTRPEDIRAKYNIPSLLVGAALATEVANRRAIGKIENVQAAVVAYLLANFTFASPTVTVFEHERLTGSNHDDDHTITIRIPPIDDVGILIFVSNPGIIAEIDRVIPKWHYTIVNTTSTRSAPYIKRIQTTATKQNLQTIDILPDNPFNIIASSESDETIDRASRELDWVPPETQLQLADNIVSKEDPNRIEDVNSTIRVEASSTFIDDFRIISEEITPPEDLLGGFTPKEPVEGVGITAVLAAEKGEATVFKITDDEVSLGAIPTVALLDPIDQFNIEIVQEFRFITNDKKDSDILIGTHEVHHEYLTAGSSTLTKLAGKTIRVVAKPIDGGYDRDRLNHNTFKLPEQLIDRNPSVRKLPPSSAKLEFARQSFDGDSGRGIDRTPVKIDSDRRFSFNLSILGFSPGSTQSGGSSGSVGPGMISIPVDNPRSADGIGSVSGFLNINDNQYYNVQKFSAEVEFADITIKAGSGGTQATFTEGLVTLDSKPEFAMLPNSSECRTLVVVVPPFPNLFNFGAQTTNIVDVKYEIDVKADGIYDRIELQSQGAGSTSSTRDIKYIEFSPPQTFKVKDVDLTNVPGGGFRRGERDIKDPLNDDSIIVHELEYDANKIPSGGARIKAFARYDITSEDNSENINITIPIPSGFKCTQVRIEFRGGTALPRNVAQEIVVNLTDNSILSNSTSDLLDSNGSQSFGSVFKAVHLDSIISPTDSREESIANIILFYDDANWRNDAIVAPFATFVPFDPTVTTLTLEDLTSETFSVFDGLPITDIFFRVDNAAFPPGAIFGAFYTQKDTNDITNDPIGKFITGGIVYYFKEKLLENGQIFEVFVTYAFPLTLPAPKDISILSVGVPNGNLSTVSVVGIVPEFLDYEDDVGVIHGFIDKDFNITSVHVHLDKNRIPDNGTFFQLFATYLTPDLTSNDGQDFISFSTTAGLFLKSVTFEGLNTVDIKYDTVNNGIVNTLSSPQKVSNVLVIFEGFNTNIDKIQVKFKPTYLKPLKEITYPIREDWDVSNISLNIPTGPKPFIVKEVWIKGEFDTFNKLNLSISTFRQQRLSALRVLMYDKDLSEDDGTSIDIDLTMQKVKNRRINPFINGVGKWSSVSGQDVQYRVDLNGVRVNSITVTGTTATNQPIRIIDKGSNRPFIPGTLYEPTQILFYYSIIQDIIIAYNTIEKISNTHRHNILSDNPEVWKSLNRADDERIEIITGNALSLNQFIIDFDLTSMVLDSIIIKLLKGDRDFITATIKPVFTTISGTSTFSVGATEIEVTSTTDIYNSNIIKINNIDFIRVVAVLSGTRLRVDPLKSMAVPTDIVQVVGYDYGDEPLNSDKFIVNFLKNNVTGSVIVKRFIPRLERRFQQRNLARNVIAPDDTYWSSEPTDTEDAEAKLTIYYRDIVRANVVELDEEVESSNSIKIFNPDKDIEQEIYLSKKINGNQFIYTDAKKVDNPEFAPEIVSLKTIEATWETLPRNPDTGSYQTRIKKFLPKFVYDEANSSEAALLDLNIDTRWSSTDHTNPLDIVTIVFDLGQVYSVDRVFIITSSLGASATLEYSLADHQLGYQSWGAIVDIGAPITLVTQALTADAGPAAAFADRVFVGSTVGYEVGRFVNIRDTASPSGTGEFRKIASLDATTLFFTPDLFLDYTTVNTAVVEQSNILCPGWYPPIVVGEACVGDHVRGPFTWKDAFPMPVVEAQFIKIKFTDLPIEAGTTNRNVRLNHIDIFKTVTIF